ncbi:MAG TPA: hypothetical protein VG101_12240 [Puia sp.]|jgi:hypothetical protein|nr:hypothetical protein [Puia sp.]
MSGFVSLAFSAFPQTTIIIKENKGPIINKKEINQNITPTPRSPAKVRLAPNSAIIPHSAILRSTSTKDSVAISIWVANTGGYTAISISDTFFLVNFRADNLFLALGGASEFLPDQEIHCNEAYEMSYGMRPSQLQSVDRSLAFLKIHYTDSIGTKGLMRLMLVIYPVVPDADLRAPLPDEYNKVRNYLIANKIW